MKGEKEIRKRLESFRCWRVLDATRKAGLLRESWMRLGSGFAPSRPAKALLSAASRAQTHLVPRFGRNEKWCSAQIMPGTAYEHAKTNSKSAESLYWREADQVDEVGAQMKGGICGNAKSVCGGLLHFFTAAR